MKKKTVLLFSINSMDPSFCSKCQHYLLRKNASITDERRIWYSSDIPTIEAIFSSLLVCGNKQLLSGILSILAYNLPIGDSTANWRRTGPKYEEPNLVACPLGRPRWRTDGRTDRQTDRQTDIVKMLWAL